MRGGRAATRGARAEGQDRVGEADGHAERALLLGLEGTPCSPSPPLSNSFLLSSRAHAPARCLCVCFRRAARLRRSLLSPSASPLCTASPFCACIALCCSSCKWFSRRTTPPLLLDVHVQLL